jgi:phospholipid transport system substrate-binding protein
MIALKSLMNRRQLLTAVAGMGAALVAPVWAQAHERPEVLIERLSGELIGLLQNDPDLRSGNIKRVNELVDEKLMPHVNFNRMTASSVGRFWRQATPEQRQRLQQEFKMLLIRTYSGALTQFTNQTLAMRPSRYRPEDKEVTIRSELRGRGEPIQVDYRLESTPNGWKIYDLNVMGIWLVETYRTQFAQEINVRGIDGLIETLAQRNASNTGSAAR